jgi:hypothetical protein
MSTKKVLIYLCCAVLLTTIGGSMTACNSNKTGCPAESATVKPDRKGNFGTRKGSSNLFPKQMRKRAGIRG